LSVFSDAIVNYLGPIQEILEDDSVSEIMINGPDNIFIEKQGKVTKTDLAFSSEENLLSAIRAIAQSVGKAINDENPRLDAHLPDGSRIAAVIPPMATNGTTVAIRKFFKRKLTLKNLIEFGSLSKDGARFLDICVHLGKNILVSGGTGSGKTTLLNILGGRIPSGQRLIVIEDSSELQIDSGHVVNFVSRKEDMARGVDAVSIRDLVHSAMRLRPDRIIVGEVRSDEALDLIQVMNTGHDGSMGTVHANTPQEACVRLETLCLMGDTKIPPDTIKKMIAGAIHIVVQSSRLIDGSRRITHISEIIGVDQYGHYVSRDIFRWVQRSRDPQTGKILGEMVACGQVPSFFPDIVVNKLPFPKAKFQSPSWAKPNLKKVA
jgi:pilus assembly protein CpaF